MQRLWQADLDRGPDVLLIGRGPVNDNYQDWIQPIDRWTLLLYHDPVVVHLNVHTYEVGSGSVMLFPPGCHGRHHRVSDETTCHFATFSLPGRHGVRQALPVTWTPSPEFREAFDIASKSVGRTPERGFAFVWFQLWHVSRPMSDFRSNSELYDAEAFILANLNRSFRIEELADAVGSSSRTLLRLFQLEHGTTISQFIKNRRVQEATRLLTETGLSLKAIGARVGVTDSQQLNKLIRYATGLSPSDYRRMKS